MPYLVFLDAVITDGITAARRDYCADENKCAGAIAGFEACRTKSCLDLYEIFLESQEYVNKAYFDHDLERYWWFRAYQVEVEWVCNVVSAVLVNKRGFKPILSYMPTYNAVLKALAIFENDKKKSS